MKKVLLLLATLFTTCLLSIFGQVQQPVKWTFEVKDINKYEVQVIAYAIIDDGWKMYGIKVPENGPFPTNIVFEKSDDYRPIKNPVEVTPSILKYDAVFNMDVPFFKKTATISQNIRIVKRPALIKGYVDL